jgi:hypothetical protein
MGRLSVRGLWIRAYAMLPVSPPVRLPLCSKDDCLNAASDLQILHDGVMQRFPVVFTEKGSVRFPCCSYCGRRGEHVPSRQAPSTLTPAQGVH